jgi:hypothetical protein
MRRNITEFLKPSVKTRFIYGLITGLNICGLSLIDFKLRPYEDYKKGGTFMKKTISTIGTFENPWPDCIS